MPLARPAPQMEVQAGLQYTETDTHMHSHCDAQHAVQISPRSLAVIGYHARRARGKHGRDATKYGKSHASATNYFTHHAQRISMAAANGEAAWIHQRS